MLSEQEQGVAEAPRPATNVVYQLLTKMITQDTPFFYKGRFWNLSDPKLPPEGGVRFVNDQIRALKEKLKEQAG